MNRLAATCKAINNANRKGKRQVLVRFTTKITVPFLEKMQKCGYVSTLTYVHDNRQGKVIVGLNGRLNKCGAICPSYCLNLAEVEKFKDRVLPARQFGHVLLTTDKGVIDHNECIATKAGGRVLGFFY